MEKFSDRVFWLKNKLLRKDAMALYEEALRNEQLPLAEIERINWEKRRRLVKCAYEHVPFYKEYYDANGFHPSMLGEKVGEGWAKVPVLEKQFVRERMQDLVNPDVPRNCFSESTTGGSTGTPLKVYCDNRFKPEILGWRAFRWWNVSPADNVGIVHRRVPTSFVGKLKNRALWWPTRRAYLNASSMTDGEIGAFGKELIVKKTVWLQGYVGALERIADYVINNNIHIDSLRMVWSTSAPLHPNVRRKLETAFGGGIIMNQYGSCEIANIAIQCKHSPHIHINYDFVHVDVVDENNYIIMDEEGDILVTNLTNFAFPLIKYRLGDRGCRLSEPCTCGCHLPLMKEVKGRISDAVYTPEGLYIDGSYLTTLFDSYYNYFDQFQIYQKKDYNIDVFVKVKKDAPQDLVSIKNKILERLRQDVRGEVKVEMHEVERIKEDRGKIRYIISEISLARLK